MWTPSHDFKTQAFVKSLASDVARGSELEADRLDASTFSAFAATFQESVTRALSDLAASINVAAPVNRLPAELLCEIAHNLPLPSLGRTRSVCRKWRDTFDRDTRLWSNIDVHLNDYPTRWTKMLDPLLARSRKFPLRLQVLFHCTSHAFYFQECLKLICLHMDHIVELSIALPSSGIGLCCSALSTVPAPILETFRILAVDGTSGHLIRNIPEGLFAGHAPRLHTLYAKGAIVSPAGGVGLARLRTITYDHYPALALVSSIINSLENCPALEKLVLVTGAIADPTQVPMQYVPSVKTLLLADMHADGTQALLDYFEAVPTTILSYGNHTAVAPARLVSHFSQGDTFKELDMCIRPCGLYSQPRESPLCTVSVNGALVDVDVSLLLLRDVFSISQSETVQLGALERLALPLPLGDLLMLVWPRLTTLRHLTLYTDGQWSNVLPTILSQHDTLLALDTLTFVAAARVQRTVDPPVWHDVILRIVVALCNATSGRVRRLVLVGFPAVAEDDLKAYADEVAHEPALPADRRPGCEQWYWEMGEDNAMHL